MSWFTDANVEALYDREHIIEAIAIDADFPSGHVRLTTWPAGLTLNGNTFTSVTGIADIEETEESTRRIFEPRVYSLSGVDPSVIPESEIDNAWGRQWIEYLIGIDPDTYQIVGYEIAYDGHIGRINRVDGPNPLIQVRVNHFLAQLNQPDGWRRTNGHHQQFFPGDTGYTHAESLTTTDLMWGGLPVVPGGPRGPGGKPKPSPPGDGMHEY
jgi:hypothetical protein